MSHRVSPGWVKYRMMLPSGAAAATGSTSVTRRAAALSMPLMVTRMTYLISTRSLVMALASTSLRDSSSSSSYPAWAAKVTRKGSSCRTDTGAPLSSVMYSRVISSMPSAVSLPPICSHSVNTGVAAPIVRNADIVIVEVNEHMPKVHGGYDECVHVSEVDYIVEGEHEPLPQRSYRAPSEEDKTIARLVAQQIPDGAVLSLGVGSVPFTVAQLLADSDLKDLGCHTGTISDAFLQLYRAGKLTNRRKELDTGLSAWNLAMGSQELYDWLDQEPELFRPADVDYIHSPERIGRMKNVISINGGVELDLMGQENGESAGARQLSGIGGQMDFLEGAFRSRGGKGFICLNSVHRKKDGTLKSNILPCIPAGSTVSVPRTMIQYVVTEYGVACLTGLSLAERACAMASIAHPQFRAGLEEYAREYFK